MNRTHYKCEMLKYHSRCSESYDAWTRQNGLRTRIRRGPMWVAMGDASARASVPCPFFFLIQVDLRCLGPIHAEIVETHQFRSFRCRTGWFRSKFKKRKKEKEKVQNAPFELNNKTLNYLSSQPNSFFNLQLSLILCAPQSPLGSLLSVTPFSQTHLVTP